MTTTVVTGGTGKTGRRVVERLRARGVPLRAATRSTGPRLDWADDTTWDAVLEDAGAVYLAYAPDAGLPGAAEVLGAFARRCAERGATRLVLLSGRGEQGARRSEEAVAASGVATVVVRSSFFAQGFSEDFLADGVRAGVIALPAGEVAEPFVDADDVADVAVAALTGALAPGLHEVTGPASWTFAQVADVLAGAAARPVRYEAVSAAAFAAGLVDAGVPGEEAAALAALFGEVLDGRNAAPTAGVLDALGRAPRGLSEVVREAAAAGAWG